MFICWCWCSRLERGNQSCLMIGTKDSWWDIIIFYQMSYHILSSYHHIMTYHMLPSAAQSSALWSPLLWRRKFLFIVISYYGLCFMHMSTTVEKFVEAFVVLHAEGHVILSRNYYISYHSIIKCDISRWPPLLWRRTLLDFASNRLLRRIRYYSYIAICTLPTYNSYFFILFFLDALQGHNGGTGRWSRRSWSSHHDLSGEYSSY